MELKLFSTDSARNVIGKVLTNELSLNINLRRDFDISSPTLRLQIPAQNNALNFNYCQIVELNRFYFIETVNSVNADIWEFVCSCDVLETYKNEILSSNARLRRNVRTGDYLSANLESNTNATITLYESDKGFSGEPTMILSTVGGSSS